VIDHVIAEPVGGAHRDPKAVYEAVRTTLSEMMKDLSGTKPIKLIAQRRSKFLDMGSKGLAA